MSKKLGEMWKATAVKEKAKYEVCIPSPMIDVSMQLHCNRQDYLNPAAYTSPEDA